MRKFPILALVALSCSAVAQLTTGILIDRRYDRSATSALPIVPWYPLVYWVIVGMPAVIVTIPTLLHRRHVRNVRWNPQR